MHIKVYILVYKFRSKHERNIGIQENAKKEGGKILQVGDYDSGHIQAYSKKVKEII